METPVAEVALALGSKTIDTMRANPLAAPPLAPALQGVAEEISVRNRTEALGNLLERELATGSHASDLVCDIWRGARALDRAALRCLVSLLEVRLSGYELMRRAVRGTQLFRALRRAERGASEYAQGPWGEVLESGRSYASKLGVRVETIARPEVGQSIARRARALLDALLQGKIREPEVGWLTGFAEVEMRATSLRLAALAEKVGSHDGRRISWLLPVLSKQEERIRDTRAVLVELPAPDELVKRAPVLMTRLEDRGFDGLVRELGARPEGLEVARALVLTAWRAPLASELAFFAGIVRLLGDRFQTGAKVGLDPARALLLALMTRRPEGLVLELNPMEVRTTTALWEALSVRARSGRFVLPWETRYEPMLPEDGVPELVYPAIRRSPDLRILVLSNVGNEQVMTGLLSVPRVSALPGLIEAVVLRTRSVKILLEIANRRELHTGMANRGVPRALLWHPSSVPISALRKFVHVRYIDRGDLAALCGRGSRARPEIRQMAASYLDSLSSS